MSDNPATVPEWMGRLADANTRIAELEADLAHAESERMEAEESWCVQRDRAITAEDALAQRTTERDRWRYLAEKATWCFREGMYLLHNHNPHSGSWFVHDVTRRWETKGWAGLRLQRFDLRARAEEGSRDE